MARQFDVVIERDEEGLYVASVPQLPGCHTDATSLHELMVEIREAIEACLEVEGAESPGVRRNSARHHRSMSTLPPLLSSPSGRSRGHCPSANTQFGFGIVAKNHV